MSAIDSVSNILNPETEIKTETDKKWYENRKLKLKRFFSK